MSRAGLVRGGGAVVLGVVAATITTTHGNVGADSLWVLQVAARMEAGDVLYRDIFAGVPPLAFLAARAAARVLGLELVVLRALLVAVVALSYLVAADLLRRIARTDRYHAVLAGMMGAWALPAITSLYQPLANLFLLASLDAVAWWSDRGERAGVGRALPLWLAGAAAGLSFLSKHTVGACALLAVGAAIASARAGERRGRACVARDLASAGAGFALTVSAGLAPVAASGGWPQFLDYTVLNKGTYLRVAGLPYLVELQEYLARLRPGALDLHAFVLRQPVVLPLLMAPALVAVVAARGRLAAGAGLVAALAAAELASLFPRADIEHVVPAVPGMLVVMLAGWHLGASSSTAAWRKLTELACVVAIAAALAVRLGASASALVSDRLVWSVLPHLQHVPLHREQAAQIDAQARALRAAAPSRELFQLFPEASLYYLVAGTENPTPFDYPLVTALGRSGEADLIARLADGRLDRVCMRPVEGPMAPAGLQDAVRTYLGAEADLGVCTLYGPRQ